MSSPVLLQKQKVKDMVEQHVEFGMKKSHRRLRGDMRVVVKEDATVLRQSGQFWFWGPVH